MKLKKQQKQPKRPNLSAKSKRVFKLSSVRQVLNFKAISKKYISMTIFKKLSISFLVISVISNVLIGTVGVVNLKNSNNMSQKIYSEDLVTLSPLYRIETDFISMKTKVNGNDVFENIGAISTLSTELNKELAKYSKMVTDPNEKATLNEMTTDICDYLTLINEALNKFAMNDTKAAYALINGDISKKSSHFDALVNGLFNQKIAEAKERNANSQQGFIMSFIAISGMTLIAILLSAFAGRMNAKLISEPINNLVKSANDIAEGNLNTVIDKGNGDEISILAGSLEKIVSSLKLMHEDVENLIGGAVEGNLSVRADTSRQRGTYSEIIDGVNKLLDTITVPLNTAADYIDDISRGNIPEKITDDYKGDFNRIKLSLNTCIDSVNALIDDAEMLSEAAVAGNLSVRADAAHHNGDFAKVINGVNNTLDAIIAPLNTAADYVDDISRGDIPEEITDDFKGDFNRIKASLNTCIHSVNALIEDAGMLSEAAVVGNLSVRADAARHNGDFRKIIEGVNSTLDSVVNPLMLAEDYVGRISRGDIPQKLTDVANGEYETFNNSINTCIDAINLLIEDATMLSDASQRGDLSVRADTGRHHGDFRKIIEGVNNTFDAMAKPVQEAVAVLSQLAEGNLSAQLVGDYKGDLAQIKGSINSMTIAWAGYISEISSVLSQMSEGTLDVEINSEFKGDFVKIKDSINNIIATFNDVIGEIIIAADGITTGSKQVSEASQSLSSGAAEQAASVEQLTASIAEIAQKTRDNAISASKANKIANSVQEDATNGNGKMEQMLGSMTEISKAATGISKIISVIDDIAFQTNILALNAAIEAARAGSYGKGFAVVADEVRRLAARSAEAAKDTTLMIDKSISKAAEGTEIAQNTSSALEMINKGVNGTATIIDEITKSSNEQATGITQINKGIDQVSKIVQTNSATAEQSAAASEELFSQAEKMKELVGRFKVKENQ